VNERNTAAVILAAGASTRLGEPKQLVTLRSETLLERAVRTARDAGCTPIIVILGASAAQIKARCVLSSALVIVNDAWPEGMATSIRLAIEILATCDPDANGVVLMTCDQPAVTPEHLRSLMESVELHASSYAGRRGVPAYFPADLFVKLKSLDGDAGARDILQAAPAIALPHGDLDVDTAEDLLHAQELFG
jgi:molybdenum cofactor cytidylyltransferase